MSRMRGSCARRAVGTSPPTMFPSSWISPSQERSARLAPRKSQKAEFPGDDQLIGNQQPLVLEEGRPPGREFAGKRLARRLLAAAHMAVDRGHLAGEALNRRRRRVAEIAQPQAIGRGNAIGMGSHMAIEDMD